ncbi:hypothetical protein OPV22_012167 [Ensete ventricosum]|uniref:Uncharacterized protein n=1 Tax=Ensete ventricosum TaxID=4639 RepID=A0AAV8R0X2_ENSVE|nr:hypothetical protein OPV22_012167 [Ensete ventricosum]
MPAASTARCLPLRHRPPRTQLLRSFLPMGLERHHVVVMCVAAMMYVIRHPQVLLCGFSSSPAASLSTSSSSSSSGGSGRRHLCTGTDLQYSSSQICAPSLPSPI